MLIWIHVKDVWSLRKVLFTNDSGWDGFNLGDIYAWKSMSPGRKHSKICDCKLNKKTLFTQGKKIPALISINPLGTWWCWSPVGSLLTWLCVMWIELAKRLFGHRSQHLDKADSWKKSIKSPEFHTDSLHVNFVVSTGWNSSAYLAATTGDICPSL